MLPIKKTDDGGDGDDVTSNCDPGIVEEDLSHLLQDSGWAWLVCLACFCSHLIIGMAYWRATASLA